jgi:hypothetical protein
LGFRISGVEFGIQAFSLKIKGLCFWVWNSGFRLLDLEFGVQGSGFKFGVQAFEIRI